MPKKFSTFSSLKFRDFRLFFWGSLISQIGTQMQVVGVNWQIYELTRSPISLGLVGLFSFLPILLFSLVGGITADRFNRKKLLILSQLFQALFAAILTYLSFSQTITPALIYLILAGNALVIAFNAPARQAIIPNLVPSKFFINAVSLNTLVRQSSLVIGPSLAGFMIELLGVPFIYAFNAVSFFVLVATLLPLHTLSHAVPNRASYNLRSIVEAVKFVKNQPLISSTMILDFFATFFSSATVLLPIFAQDILKTGVTGLGILYAASSVGAVVAGLTISSLGHIKNQGQIIILAVVIYGLATIGFGLSKSFFLSLFFLGVVGASDMVSTVLRNTIRQILTPNYLRGRMVSINMIFFQGGPQLGEAEAGFLASLTGAPLSVVIGGIATLLTTALVTILIPKLKDYSGDQLKL